MSEDIKREPFDEAWAERGGVVHAQPKKVGTSALFKMNILGDLVDRKGNEIMMFWHDYDCSEYYHLTMATEEDCQIAGVKFIGR